MLRETRERIVARLRLLKPGTSRERQALLFLIINKIPNNHHAVMVVIKVIGH